jgi:hypothetical protein
MVGDPTGRADGPGGRRPVTDRTRVRGLAFGLSERLPPLGAGPEFPCDLWSVILLFAGAGRQLGAGRWSRSLRMYVLLISIVVITIIGGLLLASMFTRDDSRLGLAGPAVLIAAEVTAIVYAVIQE